MPNTILNAFRGDGECCDDCETVVVEDCGCSEGDGCPKCEILKEIVNPPDGDVPFALQCTIPSSGGNIEFIFVWCYRCFFICFMPIGVVFCLRSACQHLL